MTRLADLVLVVHALFLLFVVGGFAAIWLGALLGWGWIRNLRFRAIHLAAVAFVALESLIGIACPLTVWEDMLRGHTTQTGFIQHWVGRLIYYDFPAWVFTLVYAVFALLVLATFRLVPPNRRKGM